MNKSLPLTIVSIALILGTTSKVVAQSINPNTPVPANESITSTSLVVSPPTTILDLKPGETAQKTVKVSNSSDTDTLIVKAFVVDFIVKDDEGTPIKVDTQEAGRYAASPWFTIDKSELSIPPKSQQEVSVLISAPTDALPGGHYAGVFFQPEDFKGQKTTVSYTNIQVGSLYEITIPGDIKYDALIKNFSSTQNVYEFGPVDFAATIENQSDTHISPQTSITVSDMFGRKLDTIALDSINIFPYTSRTLKGSFEQVWGLGRYTATLSVAYGPGLVAERTIFFWIMPWRVIAAILILLAVIIVTTISVRRHAMHRRDDRDQQIDDLKRRIVELENQK